MLGKKIFCGLDIGSHRIKAGLVQAKGPEDLDILGVYDTPTLGFSGASRENPGDLEQSIKTALQGLMQKTRVKVKDIQVGVAGDLIQSRRSRALVSLIDKGRKVVAAQDIKHADRQARLLGTNLNEEVIHDFPQMYKIDDMNSTAAPLGLSGRKIESDLLLIILNVIKADRIVKAVQQAGFNVGRLFFSSVAAAEAALNQQQKTDGCVLIDIGAGMTSVLIFKEGFLRAVEHIPVGGDQVTQNLAQALHLPFAVAEEIKNSYGMALSAEGEKDEEILVKNETGGCVPVKREKIYQAIAPEISRLVDAVDRAVRGPFYEQMKSGVIVVGGGSLLPGLLECVEKTTRLPAHMGKIANMQLNHSVLFTPCVGLAQMAFTQTLTYTLTRAREHRGLAGFSNRIKELYREYF